MSPDMAARVKAAVLAHEASLETDGRKPAISPSDESWVGIVQATGPDGQDDFDDNRYWVRRAWCTSASSDALSPAEFAPYQAGTTRYNWTVAVNVGESDGHALGEGDVVYVRAVRETLGDLRKRYWFRASVGGSSSRFLAALVANGPDGEDDFTDERYWLRELYDLRNDDALPPIFTWKPDGLHVPGVHITERSANKHALRRSVGDILHDSRYVIAERLDLGDVSRYVFSTYPGQIFGTYTYIVDGLTPDGCPCGQWYRTDGAAIVEQTDPPGNCP